MKKLTMMVAALSLCASVLSACGDDDNKKKPPYANGEACSAASECVSGNCSGGVCVEPVVAKKEAGAACSAPSECKSGKCEGGKCAVSVGGDKKADGATCSDASECTSGKCGGSPKVCGGQDSGGDKKADGATCNDASECTSGKCGGDPKVCGGVDKKDPGEDCTANDDCKSNKCDLGDGKTSTCLDENGKKGEKVACANNDECVSGSCLGSDASSKTCKKLVDNGEDCDFLFECKSKYCKKSGSDNKGKCADKVADGQSCDVHADCTSGYCAGDSSKVCTAKKANDASCSESIECTSGLCAGADGAAKVCTDASKLNESCADGKKCADGLTCNNDASTPVCKKSIDADCDTASADDASCITGYCGSASKCKLKIGADCGVAGQMPMHSNCDSGKCLGNGSVFQCVASDYKMDEGQECDDLFLCKDGLKCTSVLGKAEKVCKKDKGAACSNHADCATGYCNVTCDDIPGSDFCDPAVYEITCDSLDNSEYSCADDPDDDKNYTVRVKKACGDVICKEKIGCPECNILSEYPDESCDSKICSIDGKCVAYDDSKSCKGRCSEDICEQGICVTDTMRNAVEGQDWPMPMYGGYCVGNILYDADINNHGKVTIKDCSSESNNCVVSEGLTGFSAACE